MGTLKLALLLFLVAPTFCDLFEEVQNKMATVDETNCQHKTLGELRLPMTILDQVSSTSVLTEAKDIAVNRAFFYSMTNQILNGTWEFYSQPTMLYYYLSAVSVVTSSPDAILGSGEYFDVFKSYPSWYRSLYFNMTLNLFAPYAMRTGQDVSVKDDSVRNYTLSSSKTTDWYSFWLPDNNPYLQKSAYSIEKMDGIWTKSYYGPATTASGRVKVTAPYFDCGRTNKWIVTVASPVVDFLARYLGWQWLRRAKFVAASVVDVDFRQVDLNPCVQFHRCKPSTECKPVIGSGFSRSGYECACRNGYGYPESGRTEPYRGVDIEQATADEYQDGFDCVPIAERGDGRRFILAPVTIENCHNRPASELTRPFDEKLNAVHKAQARVAVRLAQFLSSYNQINIRPGPRSDLKPSPEMNAKQLLLEATANVMGDRKIVGSHIVMKMPAGDIFSVHVARARVTSGDYAVKASRVENMTASAFSELENQWTHTSLALKSVSANAWVKRRANRPPLEQLPNWSYQIPDYSSGHWGSSTFMCDDHIRTWVLPYTIPLVRLDESGSPTFGGVVSILVNVGN